ncbi:10691_t:CDS:2 [Diversispora eburnea]|uniref:10691_t:CDS:1 n=1 Tax=Diversispora eburnea TaxID=1213867 RepID=A0A9N9C5N0_9GLOM|nr:10691_t:CDS:2 [Diversispora eburnea]
MDQCQDIICKCDSIQSELCQTLTVAICSVYKRIFETETKFSGPAVMGFDIPTISNVLLQDLQFRSYFFSLDKLRIWIMSVGKSNKSKWNLADIGYKATFIYTFKKQRYVFVQEFEEDECTLIIYTGENIKLCSFTNCDLESLWKKVGILQQYNDKLLFGLEEPQTQHFIQILCIPSCTLNDWNDSNLMESIFAYHLKRRISTYVNKCGLEGRTQILSIIGGSFTYDEIKKNLEVSNDAIRYTRKHAHLYGVGEKAFKKPIITYKNFSKEIQQQLQAFLLDKAHIVMSSYKTDPVTNEPVHYLKHTKEIL